MIRACLIVFLASASVLWMSTLGYVLLLEVARFFRRRPRTALPDWPRIAVVVPTLNEEARIRDKIEDLRRTDYPAERVRWVIVDGGSGDRTAAVVGEEAAADRRLEFVRLPGTRGKADQVRSMLRRLGEEILVFTDADSRLHPGCLRALVGEILAGRNVALAAATVVPETLLAEEKLHWLFINRLWWLEGEVLSSSGLSGVCYALRRTAFLSLSGRAKAEDARLGAMACSRGMRVVLCREAQAEEIRVPSSGREFQSYRRRRGSCYLSELLRRSPGERCSPSWRLTRGVRIWQMTGLPWAAAAAFLSGAVLLLTQFRAYPAAAFMALALPASVYALSLKRKETHRPTFFGLIIVLARYAILLFLSLFGLEKDPPGQGPRGGEARRAA